MSSRGDREMARFRTLLIAASTLLIAWMLISDALPYGGKNTSAQGSVRLNELVNWFDGGNPSNDKKGHNQTTVANTKIYDAEPPVVTVISLVAPQTESNTAAREIDQSVTNWVQLGAFRNPDYARLTWIKLNRTQPDLLGHLDHEIQTIDQEGRKLHFLRVGPLMSTTEAKTLCHKLEERHVDCFPIARKL
jgi:SPOR domain